MTRALDLRVAEMIDQLEDYCTCTDEPAWTAERRTECCDKRRALPHYALLTQDLAGVVHWMHAHGADLRMDRLSNGWWQCAWTYQGCRYTTLHQDHLGVAVCEGLLMALRGVRPPS